MPSELLYVHSQLMSIPIAQHTILERHYLFHAPEQACSGHRSVYASFVRNLLVYAKVRRAMKRPVVCCAQNLFHQKTTWFIISVLLLAGKANSQNQTGATSQDNSISTRQVRQLDVVEIDHKYRSANSTDHAIATASDEEGFMYILSQTKGHNLDAPANNLLHKFDTTTMRTLWTTQILVDGTPQGICLSGGSGGSDERFAYICMLRRLPKHNDLQVTG